MGKYLILLFVAGFIFRLWLSAFVNQPFVFDQTEYDFYARQIIDKGLFAWSARLYGYPLWVALVYKLFGVGNLMALTVCQALLDCITGILVYMLAGKIFKNVRIAILSAGFYFFNPFTSSLVGLVLSDLLAVFIFSLIVYILLLFQLNKKISSVLILGFLLGYLPQVRSPFLFFDIFILFYLIVQIVISLERKKLAAAFLTLLLFFLPFTYNLIGNWVYFKQIKLTTVDNLFVRELYLSQFISGESGANSKNSYLFPEEIRQLYLEYSSKPRNSQERKAMAAKYWDLSLKIMKIDPLKFIKSRLIKLWQVWEKHTIFVYSHSQIPQIDMLTYWGNNLLLLLFGYGIYQRLKFKSAFNLKEINLETITIITVIYISALHTLTGADGRYSLPVYGLVYVFAGYGIYKLFNLKSR